VNVSKNGFFEEVGVILIWFIFEEEVFIGWEVNVDYLSNSMI
jgi:hypothetical protein